MAKVGLEFVGTNEEMLAYYITCFQDSVSKPLTAALTLSTSEVNQNPFTRFAKDVPVFTYENCNTVAVTAEKKVDNVSKFSARSFCCERIPGTPYEF